MLRGQESYLRRSRCLPIIPATGVYGMTTAALETNDLKITYRSGWRRQVRTAVNGLSRRVEQGEVVGFIGPNGAGKSSTIKALMGFLEPAGGEIRLLGEPAGSPAARRHVGFLPEVALYYPWLTPL